MKASRLIVRATAVAVMAIAAAITTPKAEAAVPAREGCVYCIDICATEAGQQLGCMQQCYSSKNTCHEGECGGNMARQHCTTYDQ